ncbi:MAG: extracellular solute-binding protein [Acutalibacteraceae bacterium]|nr:extracellular solute-binding protein [Clostridia bacterium]MEE0808236.1 extracellular solute-binding protein [Acutalibacteraceae bacterium]
MKTLKLWRSVICIMLVLMLALTATACKGGSGDDTSYTYSEYWIEEEIEDDSADADADTGSSKDSATTTTSSTGKDSGTTSTPKKDSLKKTNLKMLLWYEMPERESSVVDAFTKKTGARVQVIKTSTANYQTKLASLVSSGSAPDLACIFAQNYPTLVIRNLFDPIKDSEFDFDYKLWDKSLMDQYKWNGNYYGVIAKGSMYGDMWCVYYNKTLFQERGQKTPYEIWKADPNAWTWDKLRETAKNMTYGTGSSKTYGLSCMYPQAFMLSTGKDFVNISNGKITNTANDNDVKTAWKYINDMLDVDKSMDRANSAVTDLINRKAAMLIEGQYQMQSENTLAKGMKDEWGVVPFPKYNSASKYYVPIRPPMWGVGKGSKNSAAAAEFLKYYLDVANEEANIYANKECREVHAWMWEQAKGVNFNEGVLNFGGNTTSLVANIMGGSENVDSVIDSNMQAINADIAAVMGEIG